MIAIATVLAAVTASLVVTRVATLVLTATGMTHETARFQARSAFTGVGFTTGESERVVGHPVRRRVIMTLMLLGNAGIITIATTLIVSMARAGGGSDRAARLIVLLVGLLALLFASRSDVVNHTLHRWIARALTRWTDFEVRDLAGLMQISGEYGVSELHVRPEDWLADKTLRELQLREEGAVVLGIRRKDETYIGLPGAATRVRPGDILILYGRAPLLAELDRRRSGAGGDERHRRVVTERRAEQAHPEGQSRAG